MKKLSFLIVFLVLILSSSLALAQRVDAVRSSGLKTADAAVVASPCLFYGVEIITNGSADATVVVYDHASAASGTEAFKGKVAAANNFGGATFETPVEMFNGIYVDVTGTGAAYIIYWKAR